MPKDSDNETDFAPSPPPTGRGKKPQSHAQPPTLTAVPDDLPEAEPPKPRFHPRTVAQAEAYGIGPDEIEACESRAELQWLIDQERARQSESRAKQMGRGREDRDGTHAPEAPSPSAPPAKSATPEPAEEDWNFENDLSWAEESLQKELKRIGKMVAKANKSASKDELAEIKKQLDLANQTIQAMQASSHPAVLRAEKLVTTKYAHLFGAGRDADPGSWEAYRYKQLVDFINGPYAESGKATRIPEKDIPAAVAILFPGSEPKGEEGGDAPELPVTPPSKQNAPPKPVVAPPKNGHNRIADWEAGGQAAPAGRRNASSQVKEPSDEGAKKAIAAKLREQGLPTDGPAAAEDDGDDF